MERLNARKYYPNSNQTYMERLQTMIDAYYEVDSPKSSIADMPNDDVERLSKNLSAFPICINTYVNKLIVSELAVNLPQDDIDDLEKKHDSKFKQSVTNVRSAIFSIDTYADMAGTPHLFTKEEQMSFENLSDVDVLALSVKIVSAIYGEDSISEQEYIEKLVSERQMLDTTLLALDYD